MFDLLDLQNFKSYTDTQIALRDQGLVLIEGEMRGRASSTSNGAGKTSIVDGIIFALFGRTLKGATGSDVVNNAAGKDCLVRLALTAPDGSASVIGRPVQHREHKRAWVQVGSEKYIGTAEVDRVVDMLLGGMGFNTFTTSAIFRRTGFFTQLDDAGRKKCLEELAGMQVLTRAAKLVVAEAKAAQEEVTRCAHAVALAKQAEQMAESTYDQLRDQAARFAQERDAQLIVLRETKERLRTEQMEQSGKRMVALGALDAAKAARAALSPPAALLERQQALRQELTDIRVKTEQQRMIAHQATQDIARIRALPNQCPTCHQAVDQSVALAQIPDLERRHADAVAHHATFEAEAPPVQNVIDFLQAAIDAAQNTARDAALEEQRAASTLTAIDVELRRIAVAVTNNGEQIRTLEAAGDGDAKGVQRAEAEYTNRRKDTGICTVALRLAEDDVAYANFWVQGYGPLGMRAELLAEMIPELNRKAPLYAQLLTDNEIGVRFKDSKTLKGGDERAKFDVECWAEDAGANYIQLSEGQCRRADLIATMALADRAQQRLAAPIDLMVFDELFDGLDRAGIERAVDMLGTLTARKGTIFVMSHTEGFREYFPKTLTVIHEQGLSRVEESRQAA